MKLRWLLCAIASLGCAGHDYDQCSSGLLCPAPKVCAEPSGLCVGSDQLDACTGRSDGDSCSVKPAKASLNAVVAFTKSDVFAAGDAGTFLHFDGNAWVVMDSLVASQINALGGSSPTELYAVGDDGSAVRFNGTVWTQVPIDTVANLEAVGSRNGELWAVGDAYIGRFDGAKFVAVDPGLGVVNGSGIWTTGDDMFVTTDSGTVLHYDGTTWVSLDTGVSVGLEGIWGSSPTDLFAVGDAGTIVHYDGVTWTTMSSGTTRMFEEVSGRSPSSVFAVGVAGLLLHYDGMAWSPLPSGTMANLNSIAIVGGDGYAVGEGGAILSGSDVAWKSAVIDGHCAYSVCLGEGP